MTRVVVLGATGYVGSRLVPELVARGHDVRATRRRGRPPEVAGGDRVRWVRADVADARSVRAAVRGCDVLVYLVHSLAHPDFRERDYDAANLVADAAEEHDVRRLVYLSGIIPDVLAARLSEHLLSRLEVEQTFAGSTVPTLTLRAAIVIGAGSASFELLRASCRSAFLPVPGWAGSRVQPIALTDVVRLLAAAVDSDLTGHLDVAGPEVVTYRELLRLVAAVEGHAQVQLPAPLLPTAVAATALGLTGSVDLRTTTALLRSAHHDMVAAPGEIDRLREPDHRLLGLSEAIRAASDRDSRDS